MTLMTVMTVMTIDLEMTVGDHHSGEDDNSGDDHTAELAIVSLLAAFAASGSLESLSQCLLTAPQPLFAYLCL